MPLTFNAILDIDFKEGGDPEALLTQLQGDLTGDATFHGTTKSLYIMPELSTLTVEYPDRKVQLTTSFTGTFIVPKGSTPAQMALEIKNRCEANEDRHVRVVITEIGFTDGIMTATMELA